MARCMEGGNCRSDMVDMQSMHRPVAAISRWCTGHYIGYVLRSRRKPAHCARPRAGHDRDAVCTRCMVPAWPLRQAHCPCGVPSYAGGARWLMCRLPSVHQNRFAGENTGEGDSDDRFQDVCAASAAPACGRVGWAGPGHSGWRSSAVELRRRAARVDGARRSHAYRASIGALNGCRRRQDDLGRLGAFVAGSEPVTRHASASSAVPRRQPRAPVCEAILGQIR